MENLHEFERPFFVSVDGRDFRLYDARICLFMIEQNKKRGNEIAAKDSSGRELVNN